MKFSGFYKNTLRGDFHTYEDAYRYISLRTIRSENLLTPKDKAEDNLRRLKYEHALRESDKMATDAIKLAVREVVLSIGLVAAVFLLGALIINFLI